MQMIPRFLGHALAAYLTKASKSYQPLATNQPGQLRDALRAGDVLLVEGNTRISVAIKYLTQSTWSHAALFIGRRLAQTKDDPDPPVLSRPTWSGACGPCRSAGTTPITLAFAVR